MQTKHPETELAKTDAATGGSTLFRPRRLEESIEKIKSSKIMIIDDEPLLVRVVRRFLQSAGYHKFIEVIDSREAMHQINSQDPDLVLLDIMMPHVTGLDILQARQSITSVQFMLHVDRLPDLV